MEDYVIELVNRVNILEHHLDTLKTAFIAAEENWIAQTEKLVEILS